MEGIARIPMSLLKNILLVAAGGMTGSVLRYLVSTLVKHESFPSATLIVNLTGSLLIGLIMGYLAQKHHLGDWRLFLATGICGGFTTFSAFSWESIQLLEQQRFGTFISYSVLTLIGGFTATFLGYWLMKQYQ
ncbi:MAG: fluoride efflux transporter CrcB [Chitinophagaceae bacterium]|nr:fluoride efflux transporter CrcB [Chitinophagaceae bacterium]